MRGRGCGAYRALAVLVAALGLLLALGAGNAFALSCSTTTGVTTVILNPGETVTMTVGAGDAITATGAGGSINCGGTTSTVDLIAVFGSDVGVADPQELDGVRDETLIIDNAAGGRFEPGLTPEPAANGINEIEWLVNLGDDITPPLYGDSDTLVINDIQVAGAVRIGECCFGPGVYWDNIAAVPAAPPGVTAGNAFIVGGGTLVNMNSFPADGDADILDDGPAAGSILFGGESIENITVNGLGGNDDLSAKGGNGTGRPAGQFCFDTDPVTPGIQLLDDQSPHITLDGGPGDDFLQGGECGDTLIGGPGVDQIQGNGPSNPVGCLQNDPAGKYELETDDFFTGDIVDLSADAGPYVIVFNTNGTISITPAPGDFVSGVEGVVGSAGNDIIIGNAANNGFAGGPGDDTLAGNAGNDCVIGGAGNDILNENAVSLAADGSLVSAATGEFGNGADALDGGPGADDVIDYSARANRTVVNLGLISWFNDGADPNFDGVSNECDDVFATTENVLSGLGNDLLSADYINNQSDNEFTDNAGNDQAEGGAGNDIFHIGSAPQGSDAYEGDAGADEYDGSQRSGDLTVTNDGNSNDGEAGEGDNTDADVFNNGPAGCTEEQRRELGGSLVISVFGQIITLFPFFDIVEGDIFDPAFAGDPEPTAGDEALDFHALENLTGGSGNDNLTGDDSSNVLRGNAGNDTLSGAGGVDRLDGGDGDDLLNGGAGNDQFLGGAGTNTADFASAPSGVNVNLTSNVASGEGNDTLADIVNVNGSRGGDVINGNASANVLNGRGGNDTMNGRGGDDTVNGGAGVDELNGNGGNDRVSGGSGNDAVRGQTGNDRLQGGPGRDFLGGGRGNDFISGNANPDDMNGGPGTDRCQPGSPGFGNGDRAVNCET